MRITDMTLKKSELLSECFGKGIADASDGTLFVRPQMKIDRNKRALIIGLGGSGIKTVNLVKTVLNAKCTTGFADRVSFLAIDTDANDILRSTTALSTNETQVISSEGGDINAFYENSRRNSFIDSWCTPHVPAMQDLTLDGANQKRQISKMKIFYPGDITCPNDMKLLNTIKNAVNRAMQGAMAEEELQVFIVLGISGGTGSGGIIDIAQLVRKAAPTGRSKIIGVFYLPDSMPIYDNSIKANGYAALKELDYYICARQREDEDELRVSPANDGGKPIYVRKGNPLYDMPILVSGSVDGIGGAMEKYRETRQTAAEFIVNLLADSENTRSKAAGDDRFLLKSFFSNKETVRGDNFLPYMYDELTDNENPGMFGEDCFSYNAIGVSTVAIPERIIMSYAVNEIVQMLLGESSKFAVKGFKGFDVDPMGKVQGNGAINEILINGRAVDSKILDLCKLSRPSNADYGIDEIRSGAAEASYRRDLNVAAVTKKAINDADTWLKEQVATFEERAQNYMIEHGPRAFVCLCKGVGPKDETFDGLLSRLERMDDPVDRMEKIRASKAKTDRLKTKMNGFFGKLSNWLGHHVETWHSQFLEVESSRIEQAVAEHVYGADHAFNTCFRDPVIRFIDACEDFAVAMEELGKVYKDLGDGFETLEKFRAAAQASEPINVNILNGASEYEWAKKLVDQSIRAVNFQSLKESLVKDFINNQRSWTDYDPKRPLNSPRRQFDTLVANSKFALQTLTLTQYFADCVVDPAAEAERLVGQLIDRARPRYNQSGSELGKEAKISLLVPEQLFSGNPALKESFEAACKQHDIEMFQSHVEDKMVCYRFKCALPIYALAEITNWESAYETLNPELDVLLHTNTGNDEDFSKEKGVPWADRPPVAYKREVRLPGANGQVSREGRYFSNVIDPFFQQAMEMGLILPIQTGDAPNDKYTFECLILDKKGWKYLFDASEYAVLPGASKDGVLLKGRAIAEYFARKNGASAEDCVRKVELLDSGKFRSAMPRPVAEDRAKRILRKNTPLFLHLKRSLPVMKTVSDAIDEANKSSLSMQLVPTFAKSLAFDILREDEKHFWKIHLGSKPIDLKCRMVGASYESGSAAVLFEKGFRVKLLFDAFVGATAAHADVIEAVNEIWQPLVNNDAPVQQDYIDFLQWAKDEADARVAEYFADGRAMARRQLFRELHLEDEADELSEGMKALYQGIQRIYKNLQELM